MQAKILPRIVEGYFKKKKNEGVSNVKKLFLAAASALASPGKANFTGKRWFVLDTEACTLSYSKDKGKKPKQIVMARVSSFYQ